MARGEKPKAFLRGTTDKAGNGKATPRVQLN